MPERFTSEEDDNRQHSLCLFNVLGIKILNRCRNCPAAARSSIQSRRYPPGDDAGSSTLDDLVGAESKINLSASSSGKGKGKEPQETELLQYEAQKLSLADPSASGSCCATSGIPSQEDVVSKRKLENYQNYVLGPKFEKMSMQDWTINKPQRPLVDYPDVHFNKRLRQMMQISEPQLMQISEPQLMQNSEENHSAGRASPSMTTVFVPGFSMDKDVGVYSWSSSMEIEEPKWRS